MYRALWLQKDKIQYYLKAGEFPYCIGQNLPIPYIQKYIKESIIDIIFQKDLQLFSLRTFQEFSHFFEVLCHEVGNAINMTNIAREV